jgi:anti-sigma factor RsiW
VIAGAILHDIGKLREIDQRPEGSIYSPAGEMIGHILLGRDMVREAAAAHAVYVPEQRHPVEVAAQQQAHLVQWLSKRLGVALKPPVLEAQGFHLMGGRLLPGESGQARAQFMYEDQAGQRVTLYVSVLKPETAATSAPASFEWSSDGASHGFYWIDGRQGYALSASLPRERMQALANAVYQQLS